MNTKSLFLIALAGFATLAEAGEARGHKKARNFIMVCESFCWIMVERADKGSVGYPVSFPIKLFYTYDHYLTRPLAMDSVLPQRQWLVIGFTGVTIPPRDCRSTR